MGNEEIMKKLQAPFSPNEIEWRVGATNNDKTKGIALPYVTARAIQKRLDEVFGLFGWKNEYREWKKTKQLCGISIFYNGEWITKWDGSDDSNIDSTKGGLSGSLKRCACQWGIGRYLYDIPNQWVRIKPFGANSFKLDEIPTLPSWALPASKSKNIVQNWDNIVDEEPPEIPQDIKACIKAFEGIGVKQSELENYLSNEAIAFTEKDITDLRFIYIQIKKGYKCKEDFFYQETSKIRKGKALDKKLTQV